MEKWEGKMLKQIRQLIGISQYVMADRVNVSQERISYIERTNSYVKHVDQYRNALGLTEEQLTELIDTFQTLNKYKEV